MTQPNNQYSIDSISNLGEQLYQLANNLDVTGLEEKLPYYMQSIEQYFSNLDRKKITQNELKGLKQIMVTHKKIVSLIDDEKETISKNLKQLHSGKEMKKAYP